MSDTATQALMLATEAKQQITSHQDSCVAQWAVANASTARLHGRIDWIHRTTIITLLAAIGALVAPFLVHHG